MFVRLTTSRQASATSARCKNTVACRLVVKLTPCVSGIGLWLLFNRQPPICECHRFPAPVSFAAQIFDEIRVTGNFIMIHSKSVNDYFPEHYPNIIASHWAMFIFELRSIQCKDAFS